MPGGAGLGLRAGGGRPPGGVQPQGGEQRRDEGGVCASVSPGGGLPLQVGKKNIEKILSLFKLISTLTA